MYIKNRQINFLTEVSSMHQALPGWIRRCYLLAYFSYTWPLVASKSIQKKTSIAKLNFTPFPKLVTDRLILRQLSENDNKEIFSLRSDERVNKYLDRQVQSSSDEAIEFIKKSTKLLVKTNRFIGQFVSRTEKNLLELFVYLAFQRTIRLPKSDMNYFLLFKNKD